MITFLLGAACGFVPAAVACVLLDRRDAARDRIRRRVDQIPAALPGAYGRDMSHALPGRRTHTVVDGEVR